MSFLGKLKWTDPPVTGYISNLLVEFAYMDNVLRFETVMGSCSGSGGVVV
jgi:hypothetical protein